MRQVINILSPVTKKFIYFTVSDTLSAIFTYFNKTRKLKPMGALKKGFADHRMQTPARTDSQYIEIFGRISKAYNLAKAEQKNLTAPYRVGALWQAALDDYAADLINALRKEDVPRLKVLLENFHREKFAGGVQGATDYINIKANIFYKYLYLNTWFRHYNYYKECAYSERKITYPLVGNPSGLDYEGQVVSLDAIRFQASGEIALSLLENNPNPVICEIGGGFGAQAYSILSSTDKKITYIILDIPETLAVAQYFLMAAFPEKKFLLYGENRLDTDNLKQYDFVLMPNFVLPQLKNETIDLFLNQASFSEMDSTTSAEYLKQIERICRTYFLHFNHNHLFRWNRDGKEINNIPSTKLVPSPALFKKIFQYPWLYTRLADDKYYKGLERYFAFLYIKRGTVI